MKLLKLKFLVLLLVAFSLTSSSQEKKDNLITVVARDSGNLFNKVTSLLHAEGYKLLESPPNSDFINTKAKTIGKYVNTICSYNFQFSGNTIYIKGKWHFNHYRNGKISFHKSSFLPGWKEMDRLAKLLGTVSYSVKDDTKSE